MKSTMVGTFSISDIFGRIGSFIVGDAISTLDDSLIQEKLSNHCIDFHSGTALAGIDSL